MLTTRQKLVLTYLLSGAQNKQIARRIGVHERTVEKTRRELMRHFGATNAVQLGARASGAMVG